MQTFSPKGLGIWKGNQVKGLKAQVKSLERFVLAPANKQVKRASVRAASKEEEEEKTLLAGAKARKQALQAARGAAGELGSPRPRLRAVAPGQRGGQGAPGGEVLVHRFKMAFQDPLPLNRVPCPPGSCPPIPAALGALHPRALSPCDGSNLLKAPWSPDLTSYSCLYPQNCAQ